MKFSVPSINRLLKLNVLLALLLVFNLGAQPIPHGDPFYKTQGEIPNLSGFKNPGPGFLRGQINPHSDPSLNPQLTNAINEPHPFPNYILKFGMKGNFPTFYKQLLETKPLENVQSRIFDKAAFVKVRKIFVQEFENKTYAPNRDESAGRQLTNHMYKELRNSNKFMVVSASFDGKNDYRLKLSADFSKTKPTKNEKPITKTDPLLAEGSLDMVENGVDAIMIGAVTKFLDHFTDNKGTRQKALSSGIEFGSYLINAQNGNVIWGARYVVSQDPNFLSFFNGGAHWHSKSELARTGMKKVLKTFYKEQLQR